MRRLLPALSLLVMTAGLSLAATLEKLTLDEMIQKSTAIVRGTVTGSRVSQRGPLFYTHWRIRVSQRWKGEAASEVEVSTPGGVLNGLRQVFPGVPALAEGSEYVFFLWTGANRLTHIIGLSQGLFDLKLDGTGALLLSRPATKEVMLDPKTGRAIEDEAVQMRLSALTGRIERVLGGVRR
jgi:hypothetical protein